DDVRQHARRDDSLPLFFELGVSGSDGVGVETIFRVQAFLWLPATLGRAVGHLARYAGINPAKRIDRDHRIVRAEGEPHAILLHGAPGISAPRTFRAQAIGGPASVI